jgi:hypothetical protein
MYKLIFAGGALLKKNIVHLKFVYGIFTNYFSFVFTNL